MGTESLGNQDNSYGMLRVHLSVRPDPDSNCAVLVQGKHDGKVLQNTIRTEKHGNQSFGCRTSIVEANSGEERFCESDINHHCICPIFRNHECVWEIQGISRQTIKIMVKVPDKETIRQIITDLRSRSATVSLQSIIPSNNEGSIDQRVFDVSEKTTKQAEAIQVAIKKGYYDTPRKVDLETVADVLGISKSAASQRLNAAESKLVHQFVQVLDKGELRMESKDVSTWAVGD